MALPLYLADPAAPGDAWAPFTGVRPVAELRAGVWRIRERWEGTTGLETAGLLAGHAAPFHEPGVPPVLPAGALIEGPAVVGFSTFAPAGASLELPDGPARFEHEGELVGGIVAAGATWQPGQPFDGPAVEVDGLLLHGTWDLLTALEYLLLPDVQDCLFQGVGLGVPESVFLVGDPGDICCHTRGVEPGTVFDTRTGPVVLEEGVEVRSGSRLEGPLYLGAGTRVFGGQLRGSVIGPACRVHGEVAASVFMGLANKAHDGFLGHSVLGAWVNLGAGTTTSNLKNTYGPVRLDAPAGPVDTGRQFLGSLLGDHAKTAIGTMLSTGTVVGAGASVFGGAPSRWVPPFAWGVGAERMTLDGFLEVASRVMPRRGVEVDEPTQAALRALHRRLAP